MGASLEVAVAGLGAVGFRVAASLDEGIGGLALRAVSARDPEAARRRLATFRHPPPVVSLEQLPEGADVVVECLPPDLFRRAAEPILRQGGMLVAASAGALLENEDLLDLARERGGRILVPSGAVAGLDALRAGASAGLRSVRLVTRKPPAAFGREVSTAAGPIAADEIREPLRLFAGSARDVVRCLPRNVNVAATVSFAGIGADSTWVEVWADPQLADNRHELHVTSAAGDVTACAVNFPDPANPRSSAITGHSIVSALRRLTETVSVGS